MYTYMQTKSKTKTIKNYVEQVFFIAKQDPLQDDVAWWCAKMKSLRLSLAILYNLAILTQIGGSIQKKVKVNWEVPDLIKDKGYPAETHTVVTSDGYVLDIHRIPHGRGQKPSKNRPVVFLQHGLLCSSADWIVTGPEKALGYYLADEGFDVWMGNARGTRYGRNNTSLKPSKAAFWNFSWHEIGTIDIPTMIDYVLKTTGAKDLFYVGHSQGTTAFYVMLSEKPEYNAKIRAHFSLCPVVFLDHLPNPLINFAAAHYGKIKMFLDILGVHEIYTKSAIIRVIFSIFAGGRIDSNAMAVSVVLRHFRPSCSTKQLYHYSQVIRSGRFRRYDYGRLQNLMIYRQLSPPEYRLSHVKIPVYIFNSAADPLSTLEDVEKLAKILGGNVKGESILGVENGRPFSHVDYLYGTDAKELVYKEIASILRKELSMN